MDNEMIRYSVIREKNPREIVLLRGGGCRWRRCAFCDYHLDFSPDQEANLALNRRVLSQVTGLFGRLEAINSGSFCDLDPKTMECIEKTCLNRQIHTLHLECHWIHRREIPALRRRFAASGIQVKIKIGVETFDRAFREGILKKGIGVSDPARIAAGFDEVCLLFGLPGQTASSMERDILTGLQYFSRVCVNIMVENTTPVKPDPQVIRVFREQLLPKYLPDPRVDILMENTDFGVGGGLHA